VKKKATRRSAQRTKARDGLLVDDSRFFGPVARHEEKRAQAEAERQKTEEGARAKLAELNAKRTK
jgi:hypothetical protein